MSMTRFSGVILALALSTSVASAQGDAKKAAAKAGSVADRLMANEQKIIDALMKKDAAAFNSLVMPESWGVDETGYAKAGDFIKGLKDLKFESAKTSEMKVITMSPTVSLVTYKLDQKGSFQGMPFPPVVYATTVWVNHGGTWMAMFHQESTAAPVKK
jgi:hypothetical protein